MADEPSTTVSKETKPGRFKLGPVKLLNTDSSGEESKLSFNFKTKVPIEIKSS